jgi:Ca2+-binding RTX toxin-like protein
MAIINGTKFDDTLLGTSGNDTIKGAAGNDTLDGGLGNDLVIGGLGNDSIQLGDGNDAFQWNQKDWSEHVEGGSGLDRGEIIGVAGAESMGVNVNINGLYVADFTGFGGPIVTLNDVEQLILRPLGGADFIQVSDTTGTDLQQVTIDLAATVNGVAADAQTDTVSLIGGLGDNTIAATMVGSTISVAGLPVATTVAHVGKTDVLYIDGASGNDSIDASKLLTGKVRAQLYGNSGDDVIYGTEGDDAVDGGAGNDIVFLGGGNDRVGWGAKAGQDVIEGYAGTDTLVLGADDGSIDIFALGSRARVFRSDGAMLLDTGGIERIEFHADEFGDFVAVNDLTGTDVKEVSIDLGVGTGGNGASDFVFLAGSVANNAITTKITAGVVSISGLPTLLTIARADGDRVAIDSGAGDDSINVSAVPTKIIGQFDLFGGTGNDTVRGSVAADNLAGGDNNDLLLWNHGDGSDNIIGGAGFDTLRLTGAAVADSILLGSIGGQTKLIHGPDGAILTLQEMERVQIATLGGADVVLVQNLAGTGIGEVAIDLAATVGGKTADTKSDGVAFSGTAGGDTIVLSMLGSKISVSGLAATASVDQVGKTDIITIIGGNGPDLISAGTIAAGKAVLQLLGGDGDDAIVGSNGNDSVVGGTGNDTVTLGAGNDEFICVASDGTDDVNGGAGNDVFKFASGAGLGHVIISSDSGKVDFNRIAESAIANLDDIERIELAGGIGFDVIEVDNLAGTDAKLVKIDLGSTGGTKGDSVADFVSIDGSAGNDLVTIALSAGTISVKGLPAQVTISHFEALDSITYNAGGGNDSLSVAAVPTLRIGMLGGAGNDRLTGNSAFNFIDGEADNDTLSGAAGNDSLLGGSGNDKLDGGDGNDGLLGGAGNDNLIGGAGNDELVGEFGNDTITGGAGNDIIYYLDVFDGHDTVIGFDGNPAGGQDVFDLNNLFSALSVSVGDRAARVSIVDKGASVEIKVDTDGDLSFDLHVATLKTADQITIGADIFVGV